MSGVHFMRDVVLQCRERLSDGRLKAKALHDSGVPGFQVCSQMADLYDDIVLRVWDEACAEHIKDEESSGLALVAHGGFGRQEPAAQTNRLGSLRADCPTRQ